ncbi:error-prone DNA polymerase [Rathayibacter toxicus]|uniref:Error-prone DNA polymerase n=1 Tax=Rathayibacter toxicus TaxID=145458 RepID=A0A2S5Y7E1_9MICO|nr:error-prone DNA polymerase [Rathayibacter toxicus]PPH23843.1 error-prone DNA polymerase [Rathayibacter toxicus]PPH57652.1 error-prone DNA polymerase [Rathayibacter toxicus]PPH60147.1 error-prone DNA polymerase [Rathayibacter toxicus]PPH63654.1 error-prone DNA polymerase [Rathayibacter toxicus]PPH87604.1 error-prone DNA polymerase [Rathayibacter toxicus]
MHWNNPPIPWSEFERRLSGGPRTKSITTTNDRSGTSTGSPALRTGNDALAPLETVPYAELHAHSHFSFLDGASSPEDLVEEAVRLGIETLALTDHDGLYGIVRMAEAAQGRSIRTAFGAELSLGLTAPQNGIADPEGTHLLVLARQEKGYHRLARAITSAQLAGAEKGKPLYDLTALARAAEGYWIVLTGCRKGAVRQALVSRGEVAAEAEIRELMRLFGASNVLIELYDHGDPLASLHNDLLAKIADRLHLRLVATGNVHYARPEERALQTALAAVRARRSLDEIDGWLPAAGGAYLRSGAEMAARFSRYPGALENTVHIADDIAFELRRVRPRLPRQEVPPGHTPMSWLRHLVHDALPAKYPHANAGVFARLEKELAVIEHKDFSGYFLIVHDIVQYAQSNGILCQGRGSAANSAVCYVLGITAVDSIFYDLPFERFLSRIRDEEPDIDIDVDSERREEVIQYVYHKYGRLNAAQVANVITYRPKFAVRDMAKALGYSSGQQDSWSQQIERWSSMTDTTDHDIPEDVVDLTTRVLGTPRHLGIHSGGMVLTDRPVGEVCPIEPARKHQRTVLQWDKDDCAWMGLVKFDVLGLGMLAALQHTFDLVAEHLGERWNLSTIPREEKGVYDQLCRGDSIGVFQVESRAQMGTLPRLQPRCFYDLAIEIALIRPGPIQGGAVHPYIRRKLGEEPISYQHPLLVAPLARTLGVPIFQEQLMQIAVAVGDCSAEDADLLRRAMGSSRGIAKIEILREQLYQGMKRKGIIGEVADDIYLRIQAFANFGFAESHAISFALLVYASAWLRLHYPAAFTAALLRAQPMGFYAPHTLVADARRHGVHVDSPDINRSLSHPGLEPRQTLPTRRADAAYGDDTCLSAHQAPHGLFDRREHFDTDDHRRDSAFGIRLGLAGVKGIGRTLAERIVIERERGGEYLSMADLSRRVGLKTTQLEALGAAGAFSSLGRDRRQALWEAGAAAGDREQFLVGSTVVVQPPLLPILSAQERVALDFWATGISPDDHPLRHLRQSLVRQGIRSIADLHTTPSGTRIEVGGVVIHRQRPSTAGGVTFLNLEDEHGILNVICSVGVWSRYRRAAREAPALLVRGILERSDAGITNLLADRIEALTVTARTTSRNFR